jgi:hypothetical protein
MEETESASAKQDEIILGANLIQSLVGAGITHPQFYQVSWQ